MPCGLESHVITIVDVLTVSMEGSTVELSSAMPARSISPSRAVDYLSIHLCSLHLHQCILRIKPCLLQFHSLNILIGIVWSAVVTEEYSPAG